MIVSVSPKWAGERALSGAHNDRVYCIDVCGIDCKGPLYVILWCGASDRGDRVCLRVRWRWCVTVPVLVYDLLRIKNDGARDERD